MPTIPINLTGGSYQHKSTLLSAQRTVNCYPQLQPSLPLPAIGQTKKYTLEPWYGKTLFGAATGGVDRGMFEHQGVAYKVTGEILYSVASDGTHTSLGTISGTARCIFTGIGSYVVIVSSGTAYLWNGATVAQITDPDLESPESATTINNQVIYDGTGGRFGVSDVGDATAINSLNYATAESEPDNLVRVYAFNQILYLMGEKTTEPWWNSGQGNPPFDRVEGGIMRAGLAALHSVANDDDSIYFLKDEHEVCSIRGSASAIVTVISTPAMAREFKTYSTVSDAIGWTVRLDSQWYYILTFPTADKTWVYQVGGEWFELSSGVSGRDISNSYIYCYRKHLVADHRDGNIYELTDTVYDDNGDTIIRLRDSAPINGSLVRADGKSLEMNKFELIIETGVGTLSGQGITPKIMLSFSDDGGKTFSSEMTGSIGESGQFQRKIEWFALGSFYNRIIRIRMSDPVYYSIHGANAEISVGI